MNARTNATAPSIESLRELALSQAAAWNNNEAGLRDNWNLMGWRDNCRDDVRDGMGVEGKRISNELLAAWVSTFDGEVFGVSDAVDDIECAIATVNDLLRLALDALQNDTETHAGSAIRGAKRFIDDIGEVAARLTDLTGFGKGGAA